MTPDRVSRLTLGILASVALGAGCGDGGGTAESDAGEDVVPHSLFVGQSDGTLTAYDVVTGALRPGTVTNVTAPSDMLALADGTVLVNLTGRNEILAIDPATMLEKVRMPSSGLDGTRPVHAYITPTIDGKTYWVTANDGATNSLETNALRFIDVTPGSATYLEAVGDFTLPGIGHHKAAFSHDMPRVSVSNVADCNSVVAVLDYGTVSSPTLVQDFSAIDIDPVLGAACAEDGPSAHGAAYSPMGRRAYHNLTGWGKILSVAQDEEVPTVHVLDTAGRGAGYTAAGHDGRYVYTLQDRPREGDPEYPGAPCQIGQLVVIDGMTDTIAQEFPLFYKGPACTESIVGTTAETVAPDQIQISADGLTMYVSSQGTPPAGSLDQRYSEQLLVLDLTSPGAVVQLQSILVGRHSGHRSMALTGDGKLLFVANGVDSTVSKIDLLTGIVTTLAVQGKALVLVTWGPTEGPSDQRGPR